MKSAIGVYDNHSKAMEAVSQLNEAGYPVKQLSIIGKAETELVDKELHVVPKETIHAAGVGTGTVVGTTLGILTGVGLFAIPGLGFLFGAGALVGAIAGFDFGLIGGTVASVLTTVGAREESIKQYQTDLDEGRYLVVAHGSEEEVSKANEILHTHAGHARLDLH